ncbi:Ada metal-binding domain-containing protein [Larkinella bovis]|uniref:Ada metal-binding domain-containing protein n=1 Tax=Larkinella bovis TaxID=683041 RepID=A0ABW0I626_9BACT
MTRHADFSDDETGKAALRRRIKTGQIVFGGNRSLRIYGLLRCASGKRMLTKNRVFFASEAEALAHGFRPCGHCLPEKYRQWKGAKERDQ